MEEPNMKINKLIKNKYAKAILCFSTVVLLTAPTQSVFAVEETAQTPSAPVESTPAENIPVESTPVESAPIESVSPVESASSEESQSNAASESAPIESATSEESKTDSSSAAPPSGDNTAKPQPDSSNNVSAQNDIKITPLQGTFYAAVETLNVRSGPSTKHNKIGHLEYGQEFTVTGKTADNWYQIQYSGSHGYVSAQFVSDTPLISTGVSDTEAPAETTPAVETQIEPISEPESDEEDSTDETYIETVTNLFGTPVVIALALAILGVLSLITYSVIGLFKKEGISEDYDVYDDEYYDDEDTYRDNNSFNTEYDDNCDKEVYDDEDFNDEDFDETVYDNASYDDENSDENDEYYEDDEEYNEDYYNRNHNKRPRRR